MAGLLQCHHCIVRCQRGANITTRGHHIPQYTVPGHWPVAGSLINRCIEISHHQCRSSSYTHNKYCIDVEEEDSLSSPIIVLVSPHPRAIISILLRLPTLTHGCKHFSVSVIKYVRAPFVYTSVTAANMEPCVTIFCQSRRSDLCRNGKQLVLSRSVIICSPSSFQEMRRLQLAGSSRL